MFNLIETAFAANTTGAPDGAATGGLLGSPIIMIVAMVAIFYFMLIRPENKRKKEAEQMRNTLKKGDWLTTIGGLYGKVVAITDRTVVLETSEDRVRVEFLKSAIGTVGTLEEQEAAAQRKPKAKKEEAEESAAEEPKAIEEATEE
jgi:preprotein translocase subunit YajC